MLLRRLNALIGVIGEAVCLLIVDEALPGSCHPRSRKCIPEPERDTNPVSDTHMTILVKCQQRVGKCSRFAGGR